ncbi:MAG: hypothetical protein Q8P05_00830 [Candidatus Diapherotrites archaeon]|nr:hypothetical protein [Candidatus Diapherotrites archaeon]
MNDLASLGADFLGFKGDTQAHLQVLDENVSDLDERINTIPIGISRSNLYEIINSNPNENTAFCEDENDILFFGYCEGSFLGTPPTTVFSVYDDFEDLDYTSNPPWTVLNGSWSVVQNGGSAKLRANSVGNNQLSTPININSIPLSMESKVISSNFTDQLVLAISNTSATVYDGYLLRLYQNGSQSYLDFHRVTNGNSQQILSTGFLNLSTGIEYTIGANRDDAGNWKILLNGSPIGPSVVDVSYGDFTGAFLLYYHISGTNGHFDDVRFFTPDMNAPIESAIKNLSDPSQPLGIECLRDGTARVLCLRQP